MFGQGKQRRSFGVMVDAFPKYLVSKFPQTEEVEARTATLTAIRPVKPCTMAARLRAYMTLIKTSVFHSEGGSNVNDILI